MQILCSFLSITSSLSSLLLYVQNDKNYVEFALIPFQNIAFIAWYMYIYKLGFNVIFVSLDIHWFFHHLKAIEFVQFVNISSFFDFDLSQLHDADRRHPKVGKYFEAIEDFEEARKIFRSLDGREPPPQHHLTHGTKLWR